mmetsp:Transcript_15267/g.23116  ORF Transcript_15267/g.23116 Transcript_15267/m.23116 type:complete len:538 (-) Transcript_15267:42-1655(-)
MESNGGRNGGRVECFLLSMAVLMLCFSKKEDVFGKKYVGMPRRLKGLRQRQSGESHGVRGGFVSPGDSNEPFYLGFRRRNSGTLSQDGGPGLLTAEMTRNVAQEMPMYLQRQLDLSGSPQTEHSRNLTRVYNAMLSNCVNSKRWCQAWYLFKKMMSESVVSDIETVNSLLTLIRYIGKFEHGVALCDQLPAMRLTPTIDTYNAMLGLSLDHSNWEKGLFWFERIEADGFQPTVESYNLLARTLLKGNLYESAADVIRKLSQKHAISSNNETYQLLNEIAKNGGCKDKANNIFLIMKDIFYLDTDKRLTIALNTLAQTTKTTGNWRTSYDIILYLRVHGHIPTSKTYEDTLQSTVKAGKCKEAGDLVSFMVKDKRDPTSRTFVAVFALCVQNSRWKLALDMYSQMRKQEVQLNYAEWSHVFYYCRDALRQVISEEELVEMMQCGQRDKLFMNFMRKAESQEGVNDDGSPSEASFSEVKSQDLELYAKRLSDINLHNNYKENFESSHHSDASEILSDTRWEGIVNSEQASPQHHIGATM